MPTMTVETPMTMTTHRQSDGSMVLVSHVSDAGMAADGMMPIGETYTLDDGTAVPIYTDTTGSLSAPVVSLVTRPAPETKQRFAMLLTAKAAVINKSKVAIEAVKNFGRWSHLDVPFGYISQAVRWVYDRLRWLNPLALLAPLTTKTGQDVVKAIYRGVTAPIRWVAKKATQGVKWFFGLFGAWGGRVNTKIDQARVWYHRSKAAFFGSGAIQAVKRFFDPSGTPMTIARGIAMSAGVQSFMTGVLGMGRTVSMLAYALCINAVRKVNTELGLTDKVVKVVQDQQAKARTEEIIQQAPSFENILGDLNEALVEEEGKPTVTHLSLSADEGMSMTLVKDSGEQFRVHATPDGKTTVTDLVTGKVETIELSEGELVTPLFPAKTAESTESSTSGPEIRPVTGLNSGKVARAAAQASSARKAQAEEDRARAARREAAKQHGPSPKA